MVNIGVVGCGYWGPKHIRNCHELPGVHLTTVCDLDDSKLQQVMMQYPYVRATNDFQDLTKDGVDAVIIATSVNSHFRLAREALLSGKHVLVEKPLASNSQEARELAELAESSNLVLMVGHTYEYHPALQFLRDLVSSGELGHIYGIDSERLNLGLFRQDVNVLWDLAPHDLSIILALLNEDPVAVSARGTRHIDSRICDIAYIELLFPSGAMGHVHVSWLHPRKIREVTILGSKKMAVYDDVSETEKIHIYDKGLVAPTDGLSSWPPNYRYGNIVIPFIPNLEPLRLECSHFVECITDGKRPRSDGWSGLKVTAILEAAERSLANGGQREQLPPLKAVAQTGTITIS